MLYKLKDIGDNGCDVRVGLSAAWMAEECPDLDLSPGRKPLALNGHLERAGDAFLLRARLVGGVVTPCSRCLEPANLDINVPVILSFVHAGARKRSRSRDGRALEDDGDPSDEDVIAIDGDVIDLGPVVRDEMVLALPIGPLCREACAGLCPTCGGNRNSDPCDCVEHDRGARSKFAGLVKLKA